MTQLVIDNFEDDLRDRLLRLARDHGHTLEEEVRDILRVAALPPEDDDKVGLGTRLARRFAGIGLEQEIPELRGGRIELQDFKS